MATKPRPQKTSTMLASRRARLRSQTASINPAVAANVAARVGKRPSSSVPPLVLRRQRRIVSVGARLRAALAARLLRPENELFFFVHLRPDPRTLAEMANALRAS